MAQGKKLEGSKRASDAIEMLKADHRKVDDLFKQFEKLQEEDGAVDFVIESACAELKVHDRIEMEIFYPEVRRAAQEDEVEDLLDEAEVEHETMRELIAKLEDAGLDDDMRKARFTVLTEYVKHHVEEEEKEMFPKVRKLESLDLRALGGEMETQKSKLTEEIAAETEKSAG